MNTIKEDAGRVSKQHDLLIFLLYKLILDVIYITIQYKLYGYYGFSFNYSLPKLMLGWFVYIVAVIAFRRNNSELSDVFIYTVFMLSITPCIVFYEFNNICKFWMIVSQVVTLGLICAMFSIPIKITVKSIFGKVSYTDRAFRMLITFIISVFFLFQFMTHGIPSLSSIMFANIYEVRAAQSSSTLLVIIENLVCKIVCPLYMLIALKERKYFAFGFAFLVAVYSYAITGYKTYLFIPAIVIGISFLPKLNLKNCILIGLPLIAIIVGGLYAITNNVMIYALINERVIFLPAQIKIYYFDYFSNNSFVFFTQSSIASIFGIKSNYTDNIPNLIGRTYYNRAGMWTNAGFMADAYSNLGYIGMGLIAIILAILIRIAERQMRGLDPRMKKSLESLFLIYFISLNDGGAISVIFSGGMIFILIMMAIVDFSDPNRSIESNEGI